jgi:stage III sporulation protein AA
MAPGCLVTDELGGEEDALAVLEAVRCGVPVLTSVHGQSLNQALERPALNTLMREKVFGLYVLLDRNTPGRITAYHDACLQAV